MNNYNSLSIILPLYNEAGHIENLVGNLIADIKNYIVDFEIILVDDGSTDKGPSIINKLSLLYSAVRIINHPKNKGYGSAVKSGIYIARKDWALIMDADGQFKINELKALWDKKSFYNIILGYRKKRADNFYRNFLGKSGNFLANLFLKTDVFIKDINCGFKLIKLRDLKTISLSSTGGIINFEILFGLLKHNPLITQLPITHYRRKTGKSTGGNLKTIIKIIEEFIQLLLKTRFFR